LGEADRVFARGKQLMCQIKYFFTALFSCVLLSGCGTLSQREAAEPLPIWSGPQEFSADYAWACTRQPERYDRPAKLVHLAVRQGRAVRAVGLDLFGATLFDLLLTGQGPGAQVVFRLGRDHPDARLLEPMLLAVFGRQNPDGRLRRMWPWTMSALILPKEIKFQAAADTMTMAFIGGQIGSQPDRDFIFAGQP
jgi:uncharacterized protein YceK